MVCMKCGLFFHPKKNGVVVEEGRPVGPMQDGKPVNGTWLPYKLWMADLWECRGCGDTVVAGFAPSRFSEHYMPDYEAEKAARPPIVFVKDCL